MQWAARINNALEESRFELFRMTILPLQQEDAGEHFELLLRMRDESGKIVAPDQFIAAAERYGITPSIDRWVVQHAMSMLQPHRELLATRPVVFTINLSGQSINVPGFADSLVQAVKDSGLNPAIFTFELTESAAVGNLSNAEGVMRRLRELGCSIALGDFGTGLPSLAYLRSL